MEIKGLDKEMEGKSRPGFFRGVATVVTKLFHVVQVSLMRSVCVINPGLSEVEGFECFFFFFHCVTRTTSF